MIEDKMAVVHLAEQAGVSLIITRLKKNKYVSMKTIEKIYRASGYSVDDIL